MAARANTLQTLLDETENLLLDFDGPICTLFFGIQAHHVADQLRTILSDSQCGPLPAELDKTEDPFEIYRFAAKLDADQFHYIANAMRAHEIEAATSALPNLGAHRALSIWAESVGRVAIVTNNSAESVKVYLAIHQLDTHVTTIVGRDDSNSGLLKPDPHPVCHAIAELGGTSNNTVFVGDSVSDIQAAISANVKSIGFANKPGKAESLTVAGADFITTEMTTISKYAGYFNDAVQHTLQWAATVEQQARRIQDNTTPSQISIQQNDANLLILALRNVIRAAKFAQSRTRDPGLRERISTALANFNVALPNAVAIRDVLEHFDDYSMGAGRQQRTGAISTDSPFQSAHFERSSDGYVVNLGSLSIDVAIARREAWRLAYVVSGIDDQESP
ncbi:HAD-IA family hydrolase [Actinosynnema sp. NPDC050436]|uniref:HAD family hydrolase n=1 Tax=Actinosynnema sp. NPDC050436 TaxID=3155659 RepID=UPI0034035828